VEQLLSQNLVADWFSAMRYNNKFPVFDGNPFDGMQGSGGSQVLAVSTQSDNGNTAEVIATLGMIVEGRKDPPHRQKYVLTRENEAWKIDEIFYDPVKEPARTLHAYFKTALSRKTEPGAVSGSGRVSS
jgi:hypothetical protein